MEQYQRWADEIEQFFGGLTMRQLSGGAEPDAKSGDAAEAPADQEGSQPAQAENKHAEVGVGEKTGAAENAGAKTSGPRYGKRILVP